MFAFRNLIMQKRHSLGDQRPQPLSKSFVPLQLSFLVHFQAFEAGCVTIGQSLKLLCEFVKVAEQIGNSDAIACGFRRISWPNALFGCAQFAFGL